VRAIDCDITDADLAERVAASIAERVELPKRTRANSAKFLHPFRIDGTYQKTVIQLGGDNKIEFLANGQQFVAAGRHSSCAMYEWEGGLPIEIPKLTAEEFEALWGALAAEFGTAPAKASLAASDLIGGMTLTLITDEQLADLKSALAWKPMLEAAGANDAWARIGYALLSLGETGRTLWFEFNVNAANPNPGEQTPESWWDAHESQTPKSDFRSIFTMAQKLGWMNPGSSPMRVSEPAEFPASTEPDAATIGEVPRAHHLCTDQANANRIKDAFGKKLISVAGRFHAWTGTHWAYDEGQAARYAAKLSNLVKIEAKAARVVLNEALNVVDPALIEAAVKHPVKNALGTSEAGADFLVKKAIVEALQNWSVQCEMKSAQDAAIGLLRKLLTVEVNELDCDPWAFNCLNGTIDLRTGKLKAHDPSAYITRCVPVKFDPAARAFRFELFLLEIMGNDEPRVRFLQRWFGYGATGDVREQKFVVHSGPGGNGKGTLLTAVTDVLGEYAGTAAPGLLASTGGNERHPTEIADLFGRRMVTAHENDDAAVLREGFIKQATGGDKLKGRWMRGDFFEFSPTHKLQLLTNHRPQIKGQDFGIWRRILLVEYLMKFGSQDDIDAGRATNLKDTTLPEVLRQESEGILAWIVRGAIEWYRDGLNPPDSVIAAGLAYQSEQDRVSQFVDECCIRDAKAWSAYTGAFGLYPAYKSWCTSSGYQYLAVYTASDSIQTSPSVDNLQLLTRHFSPQTIQTLWGCHHEHCHTVR
jgi:P4 family phage/plasmid primase-like protien